MCACVGNAFNWDLIPSGCSLSVSLSVCLSLSLSLCLSLSLSLTEYSEIGDQEETGDAEESVDTFHIPETNTKRGRLPPYTAQTVPASPAITPYWRRRVGVGKSWIE